MAVTSGGTPYVESSDLVANYPSTSLSLANKVDTKLDNALTANTQSGTTYTFVLADARQLVTATNAGAKTFTIPPQSSVTWLANSTIRIVNYGAGALTIAGGVGVTVTNAAKTLAQYESAALIRTGSNAWTLVPFSGGAANANFSNTATGTFTDSGISYKYVTFTGNGTLTITQAGYADVLIVGSGGGGGGGSNWNGGGGGGHFLTANVYFSATNHTVTIGAGGASNTRGNKSQIGNQALGLISIGGGRGGISGASNTPTGDGANGGGADSASPGVGLAGYSGGAKGTRAGGGGGAGGAGTTDGNGGVGLSSSITGTAVGYCGGGAGTNATSGGTAVDGGGTATGNNAVGGNGTANRGGGGGAGEDNTGGSGGSGVVIVRVKV